MRYFYLDMIMCIVFHLDMICDNVPYFSPGHDLVPYFSPGHNNVRVCHPPSPPPPRTVGNGSTKEL